jgi:hypothetical protein
MEYQKIPNAWKRDPMTNKLDFKAWISPEVEYLYNLKWIATEKVDGTNIRIGWDGHRVTLGGRTDKAQLPKEICEHLERFLTPETEELFEQTFGAKEVVLFGEGYGGKIQSGSRYRPDSAFALFDVWVDGWYLQRGAMADIADTFRLQTVPVAYEGTLREIEGYVSSEPFSRVGGSLLVIEGVVALPRVPMYTRRGERIIVKIKTRDFR